MPQYPGPPLPDNPTRRQRQEHDAAFQEWVAQEIARVKRQRGLLAQVKPQAKRAKLVRAMLDRAWDLLDAGDAEAADALLEFVPEPLAEAMLATFFEDDA